MNKKYNIIFATNNILKKELIYAEDLTWDDIKSKKRFAFCFDFKNLENIKIKNLLKKIKKFKEKSLFNNFTIGVNDKIENINNVFAYIYNYDENNIKHTEILQSIIAISKSSKEEMYNYIYSTTCEYLDKQFYVKNLCDFKNNKCGEKRNTSSKIGCCRHYKYKTLGPLLPNNKWVVCEYLKNTTCSTKCISCKLFTCDFLKNKGIQFKLSNILLLDTFFNIIQKYIIKTSVYTSQEEIINKLLLFTLKKQY